MIKNTWTPFFIHRMEEGSVLQCIWMSPRDTRPLSEGCRQVDKSIQCSYSHASFLHSLFLCRAVQCVSDAYTKSGYLRRMHNADHSWEYLSLGYPQCQGQTGDVASQQPEEIWAGLHMVHLWVRKVSSKGSNQA